jgi:hypothetical protein
MEGATTMAAVITMEGKRTADIPMRGWMAALTPRTMPPMTASGLRGIPLGTPHLEPGWFLAIGVRHRVVAHAFRALPATPAHAGRPWALRSLCNRVERADPASLTVSKCARCKEVVDQLLARALA